jgi:hypothetical protein
VSLALAVTSSAEGSASADEVTAIEYRGLNKLREAS